jgi:hypothetical protein
MNILWDMEDVVQLLLLIIEIFIQIQVRIEFLKYKAVSAITAGLGVSGFPFPRNGNPFLSIRVPGS